MRPAPDNDGAEQAAQAHAAEAEHSDAFAGLHLRRVDGGADAGDDGAAEQRGVVHGDVLADLLQRVARDHGVFGKAREARVMRDLLAVEHEAASAGGEVTFGPGRRVCGAQIGTLADALAACAAAWREDEDDVVAGFEVGDAWPNLGDDAGSLVAYNSRHDARTQALDGGEVGVAEASGADLDQHLAGARAFQIERLDLERLAFGVGPGQALLVQHGAFDFHGGSSRGVDFTIARSAGERDAEDAKAACRDSMEFKSRPPGRGAWRRSARVALRVSAKRRPALKPAHRVLRS